MKAKGISVPGLAATSTMCWRSFSFSLQEHLEDIVVRHQLVGNQQDRNLPSCTAEDRRRKPHQSRCPKSRRRIQLCHVHSFTAGMPHNVDRRPVVESARVSTTKVSPSQRPMEYPK